MSIKVGDKAARRAMAATNLRLAVDEAEENQREDDLTSHTGMTYDERNA